MIGQPSGPSGRGFRRSSENDGRVRTLNGARQNTNRTTLVREDLSAPGLLHERDNGLHHGSTIRKFSTQGTEFTFHVAPRKNRNHATVRNHVEHRDILGEPHGVVERCNERGNHDADTFGTRRNRRTQNQGRR